MTNRAAEPGRDARDNRRSGHREVGAAAALPNARAGLASSAEFGISRPHDHDDRDIRPPHRFTAIMAKVAARLGLSAADQEALLAIAHTSRQFAKGEFITEEGARTTALVLLCSGTAYAARTLEDGSQQIVAVFLPGDLLNPGDLVLNSARASIYVSASAVVLELPHAQLLPLLSSRPGIIRALWCETALHAAIQREWLIWLGRRSAQARLAHFLCEVSYRIQRWSGSSQETVAFPFTQRELADTLGLTYVHINRVLQSLRSNKLIELVQGRLTIRSRQLYAIAEFDPGYLQTASPADPLPRLSSRFTASDIRAPRGSEAHLPR